MPGSEKGHFYYRDGAPAYEVPNASKGGMRPTTIRDARKLDLLPSFSGIASVLAAPALENWKVDQGILAALTLPRNDGESDADFIKRVKEDSKQQAIKAAEIGTKIHGAIEQHYSGTPPAEDLWPYVQGVAKCLLENCGPQVWSTERTFASPFGYGGCADLFSDEWLVDFKGKDFDEGENLKTWDNHHMQLAAYRRGLDLGKVRCAIVYFSRSNPGATAFCEVSEKELERGWEMFMACFDLWRAQKRYRP